MPTQTPASRRFVLPPSTASARIQKQPPFASQFARPSQASSSPYARTPFSSTAQKQKKEEIIADDSSGEDNDTDLISAVPPRTQILNGRTIPTSVDVVQEDGSSDDQDPTQSLPEEVTKSASPKNGHISSKRRKLTHAISEIVDDDLDLPSPPSSPIHGPSSNNNNNNNVKPSEIHVRHSSAAPSPQENSNLTDPQPTHPPSSPSSSSTPTSPALTLQTPKQQQSRFRDMVPPSTFSTTIPHQIFPSFQSRLLASSATSTAAPNTSPGPHIRGLRPSLDQTLPDAFSPSRKRGQREYIYGGLAETVRGWVVDMTTRVAGSPAAHRVTSTGTPLSRHDGDIDPSGSRQPDRVRVDEVLLIDNSNRFVVVRSRSEDLAGKDGSGETWMLINTDPQARRTGGSKGDLTSRLVGVRSGTSIAIKGGDSMTWPLGIGIPSEGMHGTCKVAVLWDVIGATR